MSAIDACIELLSFSDNDLVRAATLELRKLRRCHETAAAIAGDMPTSDCMHRRIRITHDRKKWLEFVRAVDDVIYR